MQGRGSLRYAFAVWSFDTIADAVTSELEARDRALREEQAVRGLDSLTELAMHPLVEGALRSTGFGVLREQPYPHEWKAKVAVVAEDGSEDGALPGNRDRMRCDFVLTERHGQRLDDAWVNARSDRKRKREAKATLFEGTAAALAPERVDATLVRPEDALWVELKLVTQFDCASGAAGPNRSYTGQLVRGPCTDLAKLCDDPRIVHAAAVVVVFTADGKTAENDLTVLAHRCLDRDLPVSAPVRRAFAIPDRMGNGVCTVSVIGMRKPV